MSTQDDRRRIGRVLRRLDNIGQEVINDPSAAEEAMRLSTEGIATPEALASTADDRTNLALRSFAARGKQMELHDVISGMQGCWIEGFMVGAMFMREKLEGS